MNESAYGIGNNSTQDDSLSQRTNLASLIRFNSLVGLNPPQLRLAPPLYFLGEACTTGSGIGGEAGDG